MFYDSYESGTIFGELYDGFLRKFDFVFPKSSSELGHSFVVLLFLPYT
jgi:hypothetical protein